VVFVRWTTIVSTVRQCPYFDFCCNIAPGRKNFTRRACSKSEKKTTKTENCGFVCGGKQPKKEKRETATLFLPQTGSEQRSFNRFRLAAEVAVEREIGT
jgi:hypothetical protein